MRVQEGMPHPKGTRGRGGRKDGSVKYVTLPQSEILNRQGAKNAKTEMADWGEGTELLNAP